MQISAARYEEIKSIVSDIYFDYGITNFPVNPFQLAEKMQIGINEYGDFNIAEQKTMRVASEDGFSYLLSNEPKFHINYNFDSLYERATFTLAHEIGHIVLGHTEPSIEAEVEANTFAQQLLVPEAVLIYLKMQDIFLICSTFIVSKSCAQTCLNLLKIRKKRKPVGYFDSEKELLKQLNFEI